MPDVATLNSVDFRFLLPSDRPGAFERVVLLGGPPGMSQRLVETDTAVAVSRSTATPPHADAVIVLGPERPDLRDVAANLRSAGVLYFQTRRVPLLSGRSRMRALRQALAKVGLVLVATYATLPDSDNPRIYIPLDAPGALLWYLRTLHSVTDLRSWLLNRTLLGIGKASPHLLASCVPVLAVVVRKSVPADQAVDVTRPSILADPLLGRALGTTDLHALLISGQRTIIFVFGRGSSEPLAVIKIPKLASQNQPTENEYRALVDIKKQPDSSIASSVPMPMLLLHWRGVSAAVESVVRGHSLARTFDAWRSPLSAKFEGLRQAVRWLSGFHRSTQLARAPWTSEDTARWLTAPTERYRQMFGETDDERRLFKYASVHAASVSELHLPIVRQHRDFRPVNVIRSGGQISVVDWEGYRAGPAFCDLFHFVMQWHNSARRLGPQTAVNLDRLLFAPIDDPVGQVVHEVIVEYVNDLQLPGGLVPLLILYTLVELATRRGEQQQREQNATDLRLGNENIQFIGALASHREELFGAPRVGSLLQRLREVT